MNEHAWCLIGPGAVQLDSISIGGLPELTAAEVAIAAGGLPRLPWAAALYSLAGDDSTRPTLRTALLEYLLAERERWGWTSWVERQDGARVRFAAELVGLFLCEERRPGPFQVAPELRAFALGIEPETWRRTVLHQYQAVASEYGRWRLDAEEHVKRRLRAY